jgi:hypothetical protein
LHDFTRSFHQGWAESVVHRTIAHSLHNAQVLSLQVQHLYARCLFFFLYFRVDIFSLIIFQTSIQVSRAAVEDLLLQLQGAREAEQEQRNRCSALEKQNVELQQDLWSLA